MKEYLVSVIPQRGFLSRRRSGLVFTAEGVRVTEAQLTPEILADPGLRVVELGEGAGLDGIPAATAGDAPPPPADEEVRPGRRQCLYLRLNGEQCRNAAVGEGEYCRVHTANDGAGSGEGGKPGNGGGAEVVKV